MREFSEVHLGKTLLHIVTVPNGKRSCKEKDVIGKTNTFTDTICSLGIEIISNEVNSSGSNPLELTYFSQLLFACRGQ